MKTASFCACLSAISICLFGPSIVLAQNSTKQTPARSVDVKKVFGYYDIYLRLPARDRDGFRLAYRLNTRNGGVAPQLSYILGNVRTPIQIGPSGKILTMPDIAMFQNGKIEIAAGQPSGSINMDLEAIVPLSQSISMVDAANPVNDYAAAVGRAGPMALLAPKLTSITFRGVTTGEAVFANGRRVALAPVANGVLFRPSQASMRGATSLAFPVAPTAAEFAR